MNIQEILQRDSLQLQAELGLDASSARIEVQCLLQAILKVNRAYLLTHPERILDADETAHYDVLLDRRMGGEPVAYLLGEREFFGHNFKVTPATLIPRPDTELLVEQALQCISRQNMHRILDMGTGSGAIALSIARARPDLEVVAVDASKAALEVAKYNAKALEVHNVRLLHSDWFAELSGERFDIIVSNPPYIETGDAHLSQVRFEPASALVSGEDGLNDIRRISAQAMRHLYPGGWLMLEHGYNQASRVRELLQQSGFIEVSSKKDLSGIERVTMGRA